MSFDLNSDNFRAFLNLSPGYLYKEHGFKKFSVSARFRHVSVSKWRGVDFDDFEAFLNRASGNGGKRLKNTPPPLRPGCKKQVPVTVRFIWLRNYVFNCYPSKNVCWCPSWLFSLGGHPWVSMESMDIHGIHGYPWNPWISMDIHGCPWISMDSMDIHGYPRNPWIPVSFENTRTISSQNTRNQILMKWIYYTRKTKIRGHPKNWDFTGKYHHEISFLTKPWNDPILRAVILHCVIFVQVRKKYKFTNRFFVNVLAACPKMYSPAKIKMFGMIKGMQGCYQTINPPPFITFLIKINPQIT